MSATTGPQAVRRPVRPRTVRRPVRAQVPPRSTRTPASASASANAVHGEERAQRATVAKDPVRVLATWSPLLGVAVCAAVVLWGIASGVLGSQESLRTFVDSLGAWGPAAYVGTSIANVVFPFVPGGLLEIASPVVFGPVAGFLLSYVAVCTGSFINFAIARHTGVGLLTRMFSERTLEKYLGWTRDRRFTTMFAVAIALPVAPDDLLCYLAGTTRMRTRTFVAIILLCKPWSLLVFALGIGTALTQLLPW